MTGSLENTKNSLDNAKRLADIKGNPVVKATILSLLKAVPIIGELIDSYMDVALTNFQQEKRNRLIEIILSDGEKITSEMVNDVEFILSFTKTLDAVNRLATNDKIVCFANLLRNSYFSKSKSTNDEFEEHLRAISVLSFREIRYITYLYNYQKENHSNESCKRSDVVNKKYFDDFGVKFGAYFGLGEFDYLDIFKKLAFTGFVQEFYKVYPGNVSQKMVRNEYDEEFSISGAEISTEYFWIPEFFESFVERVTNIL